MQVVDLTKVNPASPEGVARYNLALDLMLEGAVAAFPTDTVWGLGTCSGDPAQIDRLFHLKGRDDRKPVSYLLADSMALDSLFEQGIPPVLEQAAKEAWPGPTTLIVDAPPDLLPAGRRGAPGVGFRVPDHPQLRHLLSGLPPLANTSANRSGELPLTSAMAVAEAFGKDLDLLLIMEPPQGGLASRVLYLREHGQVSELRKRPDPSGCGREVR
jgi:L-threonylcarbamoyladenylate synthase